MANDGESYHKYADFKCAGMAATIDGGWPEPVLKLEYKECPEIVGRYGNFGERGS